MYEILNLVTQSLSSLDGYFSFLCKNTTITKNRVLLFQCDLNTHNNSVYQNLLRVNLGTAVTYRL